MSIITISTLGILSVAYDAGSPLPDESYILQSPDGMKWTILASGTTGLITATSGATGDAEFVSFFDPNSVEWILTIDDTGILLLDIAPGPVVFSPIGNEQFKVGPGLMAAGYMLFTYLAGTLTPAITYKTKSFAEPHDNPILLDATGFPIAPIFIELGKFYKFILALPNSLDPPSSIVYTWDNINGGALVNRAAPTEFSVQSISAVYMSETMFTVNGDQRLSFQIGRRVKCADVTTLYGTVAFPSVFDGDLTTITLAVDSGNLSASPTGVYVGTLLPGKSGMPNRLIVGTRTKLAGGLHMPVAGGFNLLPAGIIWPYVNTDIPAGWLRCDGASLLRSSYTVLFAAIGVLFGAVDGTHFNVPDLRGRFPLGMDNIGGAALANRVTAASDGGSDADLMGGDGGLETHTLITAELPAHDHALTVGQTTGGAQNGLNKEAFNSMGTNVSFIADAGSGLAHNNMPPWIATNYLIFTQI